MLRPAEAITSYIRAKDGNRPHLLEAAFTPDAVLQMHVQTDVIAFPPASQGREAIADILVRRFNQTYENVYTFCVGAAPGVNVDEHSCDWVVMMSVKDGGAVRLGWGRYDWRFTAAGRAVSALTITIEAMHVLPADVLAPVMAWASALPYPWCMPSDLKAAAPDLPVVLQLLQRMTR